MICVFLFMFSYTDLRVCFCFFDKNCSFGDTLSFGENVQVHTE